MNNSIWGSLTHDKILQLCEEALQKKISNILIRRNSYINRVFEIEDFDTRERIIAKFYRPKRWSKEMIKEEHLFLKELKNSEINVIPPIEISNETLFNAKSDEENFPLSFFPKKGGRPIDEFDKEVWEELGRLLGRMHSIGEQRKESSRIIWAPDIATREHLKILLNTDFILDSFKKPFSDAVEKFIQKGSQLIEKGSFIRIHGDCHKGNLIHRPNEGIFLIDFDDMCIGSAVQDLWMLLPDIPEKCEKEIGFFLKGYETFREFDINSLKTVPIFRGMRIIHFASWLSVQSKDPDFKNNFPESGNSKYWNEILKELQEIIYS